MPDPPAPDVASELRELEELLRDSHDSRAFVALREFAGRLKKRRQEVFGAPDDSDDVLARFIDFDGIAQARLEDLANADRIASLSLAGWRIFGALLRNTLTRAGENEIALRRAWR